MKTFNKRCLIALSMVLLLPSNVLAKNKDVKVNIPQFSVNINNQKMEKEKSKYPPIVYKDITYFPMTYDNSNFLGIKTLWNANSRILKVDKDALVSGNYNGYVKNEKNNLYYNASIPNFKIVVNGKSIDNSKEQYPLLIFRDITYFPLTWRFCNDEFGWEYNWNNDKGLIIKSNQSRYNERLGMSFPSAGTSKFEFKDGYIEYTSQRPVTNNYILKIKYKDKEYNLGDEISEIFYKDYKGYSAPGVLGEFWVRPEFKATNKNSSIRIDGNFVLIPFAQAKNYVLDGGLPKFLDDKVVNSTIKVNLETGKIEEITEVN